MIADSFIMELWYWHCTIITEMTYKIHTSFKTKSNNLTIEKT